MRGSRRYSAPSGQALSPPFSSVVGRRLSWRGQGQGLGTEDVGVERGSRRASTSTRSQGGVDDVGQGVGQGRREGGLGAPVAPERLSGFAEKVDSGEDIFLDRPEQEDEQRLREVMCERRGVGICCHDSPHGEAIVPRMRTFHTVSPRTRVNSTSWSWELLVSGYLS